MVDRRNRPESIARGIDSPGRQSVVARKTLVRAAAVRPFPSGLGRFRPPALSRVVSPRRAIVWDALVVRARARRYGSAGKCDSLEERRGGLVGDLCLKSVVRVGLKSRERKIDGESQVRVSPASE